MSDDTMIPLLGCPFCGATPHKGLSKVRHGQDGEPIQDYEVWCPKGHAKVVNSIRQLTVADWNTRASAMNATAASAAVSPGVPDGWKLVPVQPTDEMLRAAADADLKHNVHSMGRDAPADEHWEVMLATAPQPPAPIAPAAPASGDMSKLDELFWSIVHEEDEGLRERAGTDLWNAIRSRLAAASSAREALEWYTEQFCEHGASHEVCGKLKDDECAGCRARRALKNDPTPGAPERTGGAAGAVEEVERLVDELAQKAFAYGYVDGQVRPFETKNAARVKSAESKADLLAAIRRLATPEPHGSRGDASAGVDGWQPIETAPEGIPVRIRSHRFGWYATAKLVRYCDDEDASRFPATSWDILHYNGDALFRGFYGTGDMEWSPAPAQAPRQDGGQADGGEA